MSTIYEEEVREILENISVRRAMIVDREPIEPKRCPWCDWIVGQYDRQCSHCGGKQ